MINDRIGFELLGRFRDEKIQLLSGRDDIRRRFDAGSTTGSDAAMSLRLRVGRSVKFFGRETVLRVQFASKERRVGSAFISVFYESERSERRKGSESGGSR